VPSFFVSKYMFGALFSLHKMSVVEKGALGVNNESPIGEFSLLSNICLRVLFIPHRISAVEKESLGANNESPIGKLSLLLLCGIYSENAPDHA
jgi:hypothetical protein